MENFIFCAVLSKVKVIQTLNPQKAHGHDKIIIRMLKLSCPPTYRPLKMIFKSFLKSSTYLGRKTKQMLFRYINKIRSKLILRAACFSIYLNQLV